MALTRRSWRVLAWVDARFNEWYGWRWNPLYQSGSIAVLMLAVMVVTGIYLLLFYRLSAPWASIESLQGQVWAGRWIRAAHRYAADVAIVAVVVHAFRMYAERRSWGARTLAWVSGVFLAGVFLVCGWTGYVMVWDTQGQALAREGARLLDLLPLFSEPLVRTFVGEGPMPTAFFFLNLFAHVALPVGTLLLLWVHVSRVARPGLFPPRRLLVGLVALLFVLSVIMPAPLGAEGDAFRVVGSAPIDLFYSFWLPAAERVSPVWTMLVFTGVLLAAILVPRLTRPGPDRTPAPSRVDERSCTGCEQCYLDCPYEAISMVPRTDGRPTLVALVDESLCVSCGICAGSCAPMGVGPPGRTGRDQLTSVTAFIDSRKPGPEDVVVIGCSQSCAGGAMFDGAPVYPVSCAGNLHTSVIEYLVRAGTGGVMVVSCPGRDCWNREGPLWLEQRMYNDREAELKERVDRDRVRLVHAGVAEAGIVAAELARFRSDIASLDRAGREAFVEIAAECEREEVEA